MKTKGIFNMNRKVKGGILVEFALAIPLLVTILYFALDAPKHSLMKSRMKNSAYFSASMIQNISQNRADKRVTKKDLAFIITSSLMNIFHGLKQFNLIDSSINHCFGLSYIYYVKGLPNGKASVLWVWDSGSMISTPTRSTGIGYGDNGYSIVRYKTNVNPQEIHKDLVINEEEIKIIIDIMLCSRNDRKLGFYLLEPKGSTQAFCFFNTVTIFKPKPGLFSETPPS
jgi:hypothetical protein